MTSKQRAYLKSLAMKMDPIMQLGKGSVTPENTASRSAFSRTVWMTLVRWQKSLQKEHILKLFR